MAALVEESVTPTGGGASERRRSQRHRSLKAGRIIFGNMSMTFDVVIRDMSEQGARLKVDANANLPGEFYFIITADHLVARAKLAWRSPKEVGISFLEPLRTIRDHPDPRIARMTIV